MLQVNHLQRVALYLLIKSLLPCMSNQLTVLITGFIIPQVAYDWYIVHLNTDVILPLSMR